MTIQKGFIIAIDGPVASGKGTVARKLAERIQGLYLYSGSVFRSIGLACIEKGVSIKDEAEVKKIIQETKIEVTEHGVSLNGRDITERIKQEDVAMAASDIAIFESARTVMRKIIRDECEIIINHGIPVVTEGRDMATVVFKDAEMKIFLTASPEVRAKRRLQQIHKHGNLDITFEQVLADTIERDKQDSERNISPLVAEPQKHGYTLVDSSNLSEEQTVQFIVDEFFKGGLLIENQR